LSRGLLEWRATLYSVLASSYLRQVLRFRVTYQFYGRVLQPQAVRVRLLLFLAEVHQLRPLIPFAGGVFSTQLIEDLQFLYGAVGSPRYEH
jgi:hypothetical protein